MAAETASDTVDAPEPIVGDSNDRGTEAADESGQTAMAEDEQAPSTTEVNDTAPSRGIRFTFEFRLWF